MATPTVPSPHHSQPDTPPPLWEEIAARIEAHIESSEPGDRLPSESAQSISLRVSRVTLRHALSSLQERGLLESKPGRGWFVVDPNAPTGTARRSRPLFEPPGKLMGFTEMARSKGSVPDSIVLDQTKRPATFEEAESLGMMQSDDILCLRRLRRLNRVPVAIDTSLVPMHILPDGLTTDFQRGSLHAALHAVGARPALEEVEVEAIVADKELASLLKVDVGFPLLKVRQAFFDIDGRVVEQGLIIYRSDRYRFRSRLRV